MENYMQLYFENNIEIKPNTKPNDYEKKMRWFREKEFKNEDKKKFSR